MPARDREHARTTSVARVAGAVGSPWAPLAVLAVVSALVVLGLNVWVLTTGALALLAAAIRAAVTQRIAERFARQPRLRIQFGDRSGEWSLALEPPLAPWPFDEAAIVRAERVRLADEARALETLARGLASNAVFRAFTTSPSERDFQRARATFGAELDAYDGRLVAWLAEYRALSQQRSRTFELTIRVIADPRGTFAQDVTLLVTLPPDADWVDGEPTIGMPPEPPVFQLPTSQGQVASVEPSLICPRPSLWLAGHTPSSGADGSVWEIDGREARTLLGPIDHGAVSRVRTSLYVRVGAEAGCQIQWTVLTANGRNHCSGTATLVPACSSSRPSFKRLHGLETFPDLAIVGPSGSIVQEARSEDPPLAPPSHEASSRGIVDRLVERREALDWAALGLGDESSE